MGGWEIDDLSFIKVLTGERIMPSKQILTRLDTEDLKKNYGRAWFMKKHVEAHNMSIALMCLFTNFTAALSF